MRRTMLIVMANGGAGDAELPHLGLFLNSATWTCLDDALNGGVLYTSAGGWLCSLPLESFRRPSQPATKDCYDARPPVRGPAYDCEYYTPTHLLYPHSPFVRVARLRRHKGIQTSICPSRPTHLAAFSRRRAPCHVSPLFFGIPNRSPDPLVRRVGRDHHCFNNSGHRTPPAQVSPTV